MLKDAPAVCVPMAPPTCASTRKLFKAPGFTVKALLVPADPAVAVMVKLPVFEIVTLCEANTPAVKLSVVPPPAESVPVEVMATVPVKPVTVLFQVSRAVILMLKAVPAVWVPMGPPPVSAAATL